MNKTTPKKVWLWGSLLLVMILALWANSRWDAWFYNPEEQPYVPLAVPHRILLTFGDEKELSRNVGWQCDTILHSSYLELLSLSDSSRRVVTAEGEVFHSRKGKAAFYVAKLRALKPDENYNYRVVTGGKASSWYHFRTYPEHRRETSFLYVGDVQDTLHGQSNHILRQALKRHPKCEILVCGGDFVERPTDKEWGIAFSSIDSIAPFIPMLCVTGNHDYLKGVIKKLERRFTLTFPYFLDSKKGNNHVYTLCYGPIQFFLLDSNRELPYLYSQRLWLKEQLTKSHAQWKIVLIHHPIYSTKPGNNLTQRWMFNDLLEKYGVDLVLQGHEHVYARMTNHNEEEGQRPEIPIYTVSHCSPKKYRLHLNNRFDKIDNSSRYYQTVSINGDTLALTTYDAYNHTRYDSLNIIKDTQHVRIIE